jgi:hypothetical protein
LYTLLKKATTIKETGSKTHQAGEYIVK